MYTPRLIALATIIAASAVQAQRPGQGGNGKVPEFSEVQKSVSENWSSNYNFITSGLPVLQRIRTSEYNWLTAAFGGTVIPTTYDEAWVSRAILGGAFGSFVRAAETGTATSASAAPSPTAMPTATSSPAATTSSPAATTAATTSAPATSHSSDATATTKPSTTATAKQSTTGTSQDTASHGASKESSTTGTSSPANSSSSTKTNAAAAIVPAGSQGALVAGAVACVLFSSLF